MLNVADVPVKATVCRVLIPSMNVTLPVGVPLPGLLTETVAVNVTDCPNIEGFSEDKTMVVVFALFTV